MHGSYRGFCRMRLSGSLAFRPWLELEVANVACVLLGSALWYSANRPVKRWFSWLMVALCGSMVLLIEYGLVGLLFTWTSS